MISGYLIVTSFQRGYDPPVYKYVHVTIFNIHYGTLFDILHLKTMVTKDVIYCLK